VLANVASGGKASLASGNSLVKSFAEGVESGGLATSGGVTVSILTAPDIRSKHRDNSAAREGIAYCVVLLDAPSSCHYDDDSDDMYGGAEQNHATNLKHLINDVHKDLSAPDMPFVIGVMRQNASEPASVAMAVIQQAQLSMETMPRFQADGRSRTDFDGHKRT
jgi:hypothetical protein